MHATARDIFITGGTGYMGRRLIIQLLVRGHRVRALVRSGSEGKLPAGATPIVSNALDGTSYEGQVAGADTFVQLVGVAHPGPAKAAQFRSVDLVACREAVSTAKKAGVQHFVYVSVAHPAPVMKAYIQVRMECEGMIRATGLPATILRPWYVLGPGHRWPYLLRPMYWLFERFPATRDGAQRLGLVTLDQMIAALLHAIENPSDHVRILDVPKIRASIDEIAL